jgi:hypothetical protein
MRLVELVKYANFGDNPTILVKNDQKVWGNEEKGSLMNWLEIADCIKFYYKHVF